MTIAISYIRYSTDQQQHGDSYRRQVDAAERYCEQHGLTLKDIRLDQGVSGYSGRNRSEGALGALIEDVKTGRIQAGTTLIVESLDRLSRQAVEKALRLLLELVDLGLTVVTLADNKVYKQGQMDMISLMTSLLVMSRAHEESLMKSRRLSAVWQQKKEQARQGKLVSPIIPKWLQWDGERFTVVEAKADAIRELFEYMAKGHGKTAAQRYLNDKGVMAPSGKPWAQSTIGKLLTTKVVIGEYQPHTTKDGKRVPVGDPVVGYYPAIVDPDLYWTVRQQMKARGGSNASRQNRLGSLFSGMATCAACGAKMRYYNKGADAYLACRSRVEGLGCTQPYALYDHVEKVSLYHLSVYGDASHLMPLEAHRGDDMDALRGQLAEAQAKEENLIEALAEVGSNQTLIKRLAALEGEIEGLRQQLDEYEEVSNTGNGLADLADLMTQLDGLEVRQKVHRELRQLGVELVVGADAIDIGTKAYPDAIRYERRRDKGMYHWFRPDGLGVDDWEGDGGTELSIAVKGYEERMKGLRGNQTKSRS